MSEVQSGGIDRRTLLRKGMIASGIVMATPVINTFVLPAVAQAVSGASKVVNFEFPVLTDGAQGLQPLGTYGDFTWTRAYLYRPGPVNQYGYKVGSGAQIAIIDSPTDNQPLVVSSPVAVYFTSVFLTNPSHSATDYPYAPGDGPITVTIEAWLGAVSVGTVSVLIDDGAWTTASLPFGLADTLKLSATGTGGGGKYFGIDDLTYSVP